jgi:hypothetical protein
MAKAADHKTKQVATRVSPETWQVLQLALVMAEVDTLQDLLRPVVEEFAKEFAGAPEYQAIKDELAAYRARVQGVESLKRPQRKARKRAAKPK